MLSDPARFEPAEEGWVWRRFATSSGAPIGVSRTGRASTKPLPM